MIKYTGYFVPNGYMGHIGNGKYQLFCNESEYSEWYRENIMEG